ncbi:hypothetical protein [Sedimentibacter sp. MB31-C6]|uniref:hypothetical protein n=1 Tax=Sedimentibacter sp. MB31-C6 TaxID=3109366 RepID=UPI002DDDB7FE|nr:hypothetical protein [Sedimentibacter sp. MB36-C1]WSI02970.1 hypothetical protein U8307_07885 [Sedimentibacter sp. MB36-C1]
MYQKYNDKISNIKECLQKKNKLSGLLKQTEQDLIHEKLQLNKLSNALKKENKDVLKLETASIASLFYTVLGNKEEQLEKEKQEALKVKLKYDQSRHNVDFLFNETKRIVDELSKIDVCEKDYEDLINKKLESIYSEDKDLSEEIKDLIKRKENINANIKEIDEAIKAGEDALHSVENTIKELEKSENWGVWDMLGGGMLTTMVKHSHIDEARYHGEETQRFLGKFKREISDINMAVTNFSIDVGSFETFADYFFDGLIFDWVVQSEICKSLDCAKNIKNQVDKAMSKLYEEKVTEEFMLHQLSEKINNMIEKA